MLGPVQLGSGLFLCIQALLTIVCGMNPPSFISTWITLEAQNMFNGEVTINHNLGEYPAKVEVQVKVTDKKQEYIFTGIGSAHRGDDEFGSYGGVIYIYNAEHVQLFVPVDVDDRGSCAYTGGDNFTGSKAIGGQYKICQVRVRAWRLSDIGTPAFVLDNIDVDDTLNQFNELEHGLGFYPDLVSVQVKLDKYISDAQGNVFATPTDLKMPTGGVVFGYDENKIRLWVQGQSENVTESGGVFNLLYGWTRHLCDDSGAVKIMMWKLSRENIVFNQTVHPFGIGISSTTYDVMFHSPITLDEHLITIEVLVHDGLHAKYKFLGAGSCMGDGSPGLGQFGGVVYVYNAEGVLLYRPADHTGGKLVFIGERWGNNEYNQSSDTGSVIVNVFKFNGTQCHQPGKIGYASMSVTGTEKGDTVTYTCNIGYKVTEGDATRTCEANGHWSGTPPVCTIVKCQTLVNVPYTKRYFVTNGIHYGDAYSYSCSYGYKSTSGDSIRTCKENGIWSGNPLQCIVKPCPDPGTVNNAKRNLKGLSPRNTVQYTCNDGYYHSKGNLIRTCRVGPYWYPYTNPTCTEIPCDDPEDVGNATKKFTGTKVGDKVTYTCKSGFYNHYGNLERTCQLGGKWSGENPICIEYGDATCNDTGLIENTTRKVYGFTAGQQIVYQCKSGFKLASGDLTLMCNNEGQWTGTLPICTRVQCPEVEEIPNAVMEVSGTYINDKVVYTCKDTYYHSFGSQTRTCTSKGTWDGIPPVCKLIQCKNPSVKNAKELTTFENHDMTDPGHSVNYLCNTGYVHSSGDLTLTCQLGGKWKGDVPTCKAVECGDPGNVENADRIRFTGTSYNDYVWYTCRVFFQLTSGNLHRKCGADGKWTGKPPACSDNQCPVPPPVPGAYIETGRTSFGSNITYRCLQGYELTGGATVITCLPSRTWSNAGPKCTRITCFPPTASANSKVIISKLKYGMIANFSCNPGFSMTTGDSILQCVSDNGKVNYWLGTLPVCKESIILSYHALGNESLKEMVKAIKAEITLPKKNTSLYKRSLTSAKDDRPSSMYIGATGVCFLCLAVGTIVFVDCFNYVHLRKRV